MANLLSPGIQVSEVDQSQITPVEGDSAAVFGGDFEKGPVGVHTLISSVQELRDNYGMPNTKNYNDYYQVQNFLAYSGAIYVSRAADINGTPTQLDGLLFEENAYKTNVSASKIEGVRVIEADSVDVKFEKTDKFEVGQVLKFNDSNKEYKIKYIRNEVKQIPNPDYQPLTQLVVDPSQASAYVDEVVSYVVTTDAESYTVEADRPDVVLVNKSNKSLTALKVGTAIVTFKATKEGSRTNSFELKFDVQEKESTKLIVSPDQLNIVQGKQGVLNIDTDASDYTITSKNLGIATIESDKKTVNGLRIGSCTIDITAQAEGKTEVTKTITVSVTEDKTTSLTVTPEGPLTLYKGDSQVFEIESDGNSILEYASEADKEFVTVDASAKKVTAIKEGNAVVQVRAKASGAAEVSKRIQIIIKPEKIKASVEPTELNIKASDGDQTITVTTEADKVVARSTNMLVANVDFHDKTVTVKPLFAGEAKIEITASKEGYSDNVIDVPLTITEASTEVEASAEPTNVDIASNDSVTNIVITKDQSATIEAQSDHPEIANVKVQDSNVQVTPVAKGSANITITVKQDSLKDKVIVVPVTVGDPKIKAQVTPESVKVKDNAGDQTLTVNVQDITDAKIVARSTNQTVATLKSQGASTVVTPMFAGNAKIIFTISKEGYQDLVLEVPFVVESSNPSSDSESSETETDGKDTASDAASNDKSNQKSKAKKG